MGLGSVDLTSSCVSVDEYHSYSDVPVPLPLFSPVPIRRTCSAPISRPASPPVSPAPTVLVSLRTISSGQVSGRLSLHEYRKTLSRPQLDEQSAPGPRRTLRRKPKTLNLTVFRPPRAPPSPPATPISASQISNGVSVEALQSWQPLAEAAIDHEEARVHENSPSHPLADAVSLPRTTTAFTAAPKTPSQQLETLLQSFPPPPPYTPATSVTSASPGMKKLNVFKYSLKQIPARFISHHRSSSDSALSFYPNHSRTRLRHRGVSFEILNPPKSPGLPVSFSPEHITPKSFHLLKRSIPAPSFDPMSSQFLDQSPSVSEASQGQQTPLKYGNRSRSGSEERRPTPPRALFEDLLTAHSSITSRIVNQRSNLFPLFPYIDHSTGDLDMELSLDTGTEEAHVTLPPNSPDPFASYSGRKAVEVQSPLQLKAPSLPAQDATENPKTTFANLILSGASLGQLSSYFTSKTLQTDRQPRGEVIKRHPSTLTKPRPPDPKQAFQWKKLRTGGASTLISSFVSRQLIPHTTRFRVEKRNTCEDGRKSRGGKPSTKTASNYRRSVSSPLERLSADVETLIEQNLVSATPRPKPSPAKSLLKVQNARPQSSVYSSIDEPPPELYTQTLAHSARTDGAYLIDSCLSAEVPYKNVRSRYQWSSTLSPNFSKPIHPPESRQTGADEPVFPISYATSYQNRRPLDSHPINTIPDGPHNFYSQNSSIDVSEPILTVGGDPGTLQSSSVSGIADHDFLVDDYEDMGPGSSQTVSSPQLSRLGTFSTLRSRLKLPSTFSSRPKGNGLKPQTVSTNSSFKEPEQFADQLKTCSALESNTGLEDGWCSERVDAQDWQTVTGSHQFRSDFSRVDTGSSLANFSSCGSLANAEAQPWTSLPLPGGHQHFPSCPGNLVMVHPGQRGLSHKHKLHQNPNTGTSILLPDYQYPGKSFDSLNSVAKPVPVLKASTEVYPAPLPSTSQYQHPTPLNKPHVHPFKSPPPVLDKWKTRLRKQSLYQSSRFGPGPVNPSYWCTISSCQDISMPVLNRDASSHSRIRNKHSPFSAREHNTASNTTSILPSPFNNFNGRHKRPFSHKYPRMSMFVTENLATNNCNSQNSLSLTTSIRSVPRNYSPDGSTQRGDVLQMPERVHLAPTYSSTEQLILYPQSNPSPPRFRNRLSGDGIAVIEGNDTGTSHKCPSLVSEARHQQGQRPAIPRLHWPPVQNNGNETTKIRMKASSRDDLIRERIRQLDDPIVTTNTRRSRRDLSSRPLSERSAIPHRSHTVASRPFNVNEELEVGQWYCSENGRYAFSTPPRLFKTSAKFRQRAATTTVASETNFALQRRVGRELIIASSIMLPPGWLLLGYIALVGQGANWLIKWRSGGEVEQFHEKEIRFARQVFGAVFLVLVIIAFVTATAFLASKDN
ncbi:hypothetical protein, variant 1 [Blastomyces gilchristii SLH14081]|uniref:Uncharacterized protein n=1 Tax=Blastomyces gilchristii (strain SLH14081) TaxID=559298 RepID=A0A179UK40_BLAGS|nr:hypothetical protein, variant 1 [Blastomyces gilchristii SLH14081]OAT07588.1 hypothetical protein, variant 1 [Blastomyces gilchristii SLH14081]